MKDQYGSADVRARYLDLLEDVLTGVLFEDPPLLRPGVEGYSREWRENGLDWPSRALTMVGGKRLRNFRTLIERALDDGVPGDILETGVWRGGACILARAVLAAHGVADRRVIVADSFAGLPPPDASYPADAESVLHEEPDLAVSLEQVQANFRRFGLLDDQVVFLKGWFKDTLPTAPTSALAVLRLDGDMYESTLDALSNLYDKVSAGGWVIIDDYSLVPACRQAVWDFFAPRGAQPALHKIDPVGVYFQKTS